MDTPGIVQAESEKETKWANMKQAIIGGIVGGGLVLGVVLLTGAAGPGSRTLDGPLTVRGGNNCLGRSREGIFWS